METDILRSHAVYQIYPISFCDSNKDGKGDLKGIISKLDYLQKIGIHLLWLSPIYESPMADMGYDISDYRKINPMFGTMEDFDTLLAEAKKRDIRIIMDLVVNHTSNQHRWFKEALADPNSKYRDYYYFRKGKEGKLPNNWMSTFQGPAWEKVNGEDDTYYLHIFTKEQPDLNWHSEDLIKDVESILSFWLDKGVFGFRCDVISGIYKESLEDGKKTKHGQNQGSEHYIATPGCHKILQRLRKEVIDPHHGILIGECMGATLENIPPFIATKELDTFFSFDHVNLGSSSLKELCDVKKFKKIVMDWQTKVENNGVYLENHDQHRSVNKLIEPGYEKAGSKMLLTMIYTLKGMPFIYQGQELGAMNYPAGYFTMEETNDVVVRNVYKMMMGLHVPEGYAKKFALKCGRDDARAPMAFNGSKGYGFSDPSVTPWQKYNPLCSSLNVEDEEKDPDSTLSYFEKINPLRENNPVLCFGDIQFLKTKGKLMAYTRTYNGKSILVLLNLSKKQMKLKRSIKEYGRLTPLIDNYSSLPTADILRPYEARVLEIN